MIAAHQKKQACCCVTFAKVLAYALQIWHQLVQETWGHVEFKFTQHKGTDVYLVKMAEEDFEALEDNQVLVQARLQTLLS